MYTQHHKAARDRKQHTLASTHLNVEHASTHLATHASVHTHMHTHMQRHTWYLVWTIPKRAWQDPTQRTRGCVPQTWSWCWLPKRLSASAMPRVEAAQRRCIGRPVYPRLYPCAPSYVRVCVCEIIHMLYVYICIYLYIHIYVRIYVYMCVYIHLYIYTYIYVYMHVHRYI